MGLSIWDSAVWLLLITGTLLGLSLPFGKLSGAAGVAPVIWAFVISFGAGAVLLTALLARRQARWPDAGRLRYFVITAAVSYAFPNLLIMSAIPHLGAGFTGIMFTLSPVITLTLSVLFGMRRPNALGIAGIVVGFAGALIVSLTRGEAGRPAEAIWVVIGLAIPFSLACGNIYRTLDWPKNAGPIELAAGSHLASAAMLIVISLVISGSVPLAPLAGVPLLTLAQAAASAAMFAFFFRLQAVGGPVYLSQIGYVAAALGLVAGTVFLDERYQLATWAGAAIIMAGVAMTTRAQAQG